MSSVEPDQLPKTHPRVKTCTHLSARVEFQWFTTVANLGAFAVTHQHILSPCGSLHAQVLIGALQLPPLKQTQSE